MPSLGEIIGLPPTTSAAEPDNASELRFQEFFDRAAHGDVHAQGELVRLRVAYLNWADARQNGSSCSKNLRHKYPPFNSL